MKPRQMLLSIVRCIALNKKGKPCPFRKKHGEHCGHHHAAYIRSFKCKKN